MGTFSVICLTACPALVDDTEIVTATARPVAGGWTVSVTLAHPDTGRDHHADGWEILSPDDTGLGIRAVLHPHQTEGPLTRSLSGLQLSNGIPSSPSAPGAAGMAGAGCSAGWRWTGAAPGRGGQPPHPRDISDQKKRVRGD